MNYRQMISKTLSALVIFFFAALYASGQQAGAPHAFNYQAVARDFNGDEMREKNILVRISIIKDSPTGDVMWCEKHTVTTNKFGLFTITIGQGSRESGEMTSFSDIQWGSAPHYLKVEVDFHDGQGYLPTEPSRLLSVPYAIYANYAANGGTGGGLDGDTDPTNERQNLSMKNDTLLQLINNDGSIQSSVKVDFDPGNEIQDLSLNNHILKITNNAEANDIHLTPYLDNTDNQILYNKDDSIGITGGNKINLSRFRDNTDNQVLSLETDSLQISGGNAVSIAGLKNPQSIVFYVEKNTISTVNIASDNYLVFDEKKLNIGNAYSLINGNFSVPADGLYSFYFTYSGVDKAQEVKIYINNGEHDLMPTVANQKFRWPFMLYLTEGDVVNMVINSGLSTQINKATWAGFKVY